MIHASKYQPNIFPINGLGDPSEIDRAQGIDPTVTPNKTKVEEIGREGVVGYVKKSPTVSYRLTQLEYGSLEFWRKLCNKADSVVTLTVADFKTPTFDIAAYLTDDDDTFRGTLWYPKLRTSGFSVSVGDPDAIAERSFDLVGEEAVTWQGANKYVIYKNHDAGSGADDTIDLSAKVPVADPDVAVGESDAAKYIMRIQRIRSGVSAELVPSTDYTYSTGTKIVTIVSAVADDVYKVWYTSSTAPDSLFTPNDSDLDAVAADSVSIYLYIPASGSPTSSDYVYRLQSVSIDVAFDREDLKEIGNKRVVQRGINNTTVTVALGRILEEFTIEEVLRGAGADYGKIDVEQLTDNATLIVKIFEDNTKAVLKYGFKATGLSPTELSNGVDVNSYVEAGDTLEGENLTISSDNSELGSI